jgi:hypothetical protein
MRVQLLAKNKPYEVLFKSIDEGRMYHQAEENKRGSSNTLYPVWRLVDAATGKDVANAALSLQDPLRNGPIPIFSGQLGRRLQGTVRSSLLRMHQGRGTVERPPELSGR